MLINHTRNVTHFANAVTDEEDLSQNTEKKEK